MDRNRGLGIALVAVGALLLLGRAWGGAGETWPFFVILPGLVMLGAALLNPRDAARLAVPGSIVTTVGILLFVMEALDAYESWAYAWALVLAASGAGAWLLGRLTADDAKRDGGYRTAMMGLVLFVAFGAFFELFIFNNLGGSVLGRYLLPLLLIGGGAVLLARHHGAPQEAPSETEPRE